MLFLVFLFVCSTTATAKASCQALHSDIFTTTTLLGENEYLKVGNFCMSVSKTSLTLEYNVELFLPLYFASFGKPHDGLESVDWIKEEKLLMICDILKRPTCNVKLIITVPVVASSEQHEFAVFYELIQDE